MLCFDHDDGDDDKNAKMKRKEQKRCTIRTNARRHEGRSRRKEMSGPAAVQKIDTLPSQVKTFLFTAIAS
jgi:hypothetical protein